MRYKVAERARDTRSLVKMIKMIEARDTIDEASPIPPGPKWRCRSWIQHRLRRKAESAIVVSAKRARLLRTGFVTEQLVPDRMRANNGVELVPDGAKWT